MLFRCVLIRQKQVTTRPSEPLNKVLGQVRSILMSWISVSAAKDTTGNTYHCRNSGYDTSCDVTSGFTSFYVSGCCTRD